MHRESGSRGLGPAIVALLLASGCPSSKTPPKPADEVPSDKPADPAGIGVQQDDLGPVIFATDGPHRFVFRPAGSVVRGADGRVLAQYETPRDGSVGRTFARDAYGPGLDLRLRILPEGGVTRLVQVSAPLPLPEGAVHLDIGETVEHDPALRVFTEDGEVPVGQLQRTPNWLSLRDAQGREVLHVPTPSAWDADGRELPWMSFQILVRSAGRFSLRTRVDATWLAAANRAWPANIDPSVHPSAPAPIFGSVQIIQPTLGSMQATVAATFTNFYLDPLSVTVEWGDGAVFNDVRIAPIQLVHDYAQPGVHRIRLQVCDFAAPPRCARVERYLPGGNTDCDELDDTCLDWAFDVLTGACKVVARAPFPACGQGCTQSADCMGGEYCNSLNDTCTADCREASANACPAGLVCDGSGICVANSGPCFDGTHDCVAGAVCHSTPGSFVCACPANQLGDGRSSGNGCSRFKHGGVLPVGGTSEHAPSPTGLRVRGGAPGQGAGGTSEGKYFKVKGGLGRSTGR